jgi:hypothetical protein
MAIMASPEARLTPRAIPGLVRRIVRASVATAV